MYLLHGGHATDITNKAHTQQKGTYQHKHNLFYTPFRKAQVGLRSYGHTTVSEYVRLLIYFQTVHLTPDSHPLLILPSTLLLVVSHQAINVTACGQGLRSG